VDPWAEQWSRVERWFSHFSETNSGRSHDQASDNYQDEVYAFFQNCYHLKDWLRNDPASSALVRADIESTISGSPNLSLCADLCNGSKHLTLTRNIRSSADTHVGSRHFEVGLSSGSGSDSPPSIAVKYEVQSGGSVYDAFTVAQSCMIEWGDYLKSKGLL
jgi:hypothetical protein